MMKDFEVWLSSLVSFCASVHNKEAPVEDTITSKILKMCSGVVLEAWAVLFKTFI